MVLVEMVRKGSHAKDVHLIVLVHLQTSEHHEKNSLVVKEFFHLLYMVWNVDLYPKGKVFKTHQCDTILDPFCCFLAFVKFFETSVASFLRILKN